MEEVKIQIPKYSTIEDGVELVTHYKSLNGKIYLFKEICEQQDEIFLNNQKISKLEKKLNKTQISNNTFEYNLIFVKNYSEIEEYHKLKYHLDYFHTNWDNNSDISCEWIAFEYIDGGDSKDCVEYYRVYDILKDVSEFKELIRRW